jgi:dTDP-4-dehydrorhamnose 3,5-epimerase
MSVGIDGAILLKRPKLFQDDRGCFINLWDDTWASFVHWHGENFSVSAHNVLRGLHLQRRAPQGKFVTCVIGEIWDVCVDLRPNSPTFMQTYGAYRSPENGRSLFIPAGCAHGFYVTEGPAAVHYKVTERYDASSDGGVRWDDPELKILWPLEVPAGPILSNKDRELPSVREYLNSLR